MLLGHVFNLRLARWRSQPIKSWQKGFQPISERVNSINLKIVYWRPFPLTAVTPTQRVATLSGLKIRIM